MLKNLEFEDCNRVPSGNLRQLWKITMFNGKKYHKWPFFMVMLIYQRVRSCKCQVFQPSHCLVRYRDNPHCSHPLMEIDAERPPPVFFCEGTRLVPINLDRPRLRKRLKLCRSMPCDVQIPSESTNTSFCFTYIYISHMQYNRYIYIYTYAYIYIYIQTHTHKQ